MPSICRSCAINGQQKRHHRQYLQQNHHQQQQQQQQQQPPNSKQMNENGGVAVPLATAPTNSGGFNDHSNNDLNFGDPSVILADKMDELTLEERCQVYEDIHGVNAIQEETPQFLVAKLDDLEMELSMIKTKPAYDHAKRLSEAYITNKQLRICFLRCSDFDSCKAAKHLVGWCELKMELYGPDVMGRDLRMSDLCPISRGMLEAGVHQILRQTDSAGRLVVCGMKLKAEYFTNMALSRLILYMSNCIMYDESLQKNGVVVINGYGELKMRSMTFEQARNMLRSGYKTTKYVPLRIRALHYIGDDSIETKRMVSVMQMAMTERVGRRIRFYSGTVKENRLALTGFGIPVDALPLDEDGVFNNSMHLPWIEERRRLEMALEAVPTTAPTPKLTPTAFVARKGASPTIISNDVDAASICDMDFGDKNDSDDCLQSDSSLASIELAFQAFAQYNITDPRIPDESPAVLVQHDHDDRQVAEEEQQGTKEPKSAHGEKHQEMLIIREPTDQDIVMGRGKKSQYHPGNIALRAIIAEKYDEYDESKRWGKMAVAVSVVEIITKRNGRFLKKVADDEGGHYWVEASDDEAREKVSHGFRKKRELDLAAKKRKRNGETN